MQPTQLIVHCADTPNGRVTTAREIDRWHAARFDMRQRDEEDIKRQLEMRQYPYCGYHGVILLNGSLMRTRAETEPGSHCSGQNNRSLGFCLVGTDAFTLAQWDALADVVQDCQRRWGELEIVGHRKYNAGKTCPGFSVESWLDNGLKPLADHLLP